MDKNTIIGFVAIFAILVGFFWFNKPSKEELAKRERLNDSIQMVERQKTLDAAKEETSKKGDVLTSGNLNDSAQKQITQKEYGVYASTAVGTQEFTTLENKKMKIVFSNKGGKPYSVELKGFRTYDSLPLQLFTGDSTIFGFGLAKIGKNTSQLFFTSLTQAKDVFVTKDSSSVIYQLRIDSLRYIQYVYTLGAEDNMIRFSVSFKGMQEILNDQYLSLNWEIYSPKQEKGRAWEDQNTGLHYQYLDDNEHDNLSERAADKSERLTGRVKWIAYKQQFFSAAIIANDYFLKGTTVHSTQLANDEKHLKLFSSSIDMEYNGKPITMKIYFGPNQYKLLKKYNIGLEKLVPLGWGIFGWVNKFGVIPIFDFLREYISNFGLIILLLTIIIKLVLSPLTFKSYLSTAKMRVLKPEVEEIGKKFPKKEDALKKQQATMEMYKKAGVNPLSGCVPVLIQLPFLIAMFRFFPASIELRQQGFLWAKDLSSYDSIFQLPFNIPMYGDHISLFTLLMAGSMVLINLTSSNTMVTAPGQPNMKFMMWLMPVMMLLWFNNYSAGLSYYYFVANMITVIQTWIIAKSVDDKKIMARIHENRKKPVKTSNFQQKLQDMARQRGMKLK